ncbi:hypothetical protein SAMN03159341_1042, partial [Paenibacillus sp. 1_12]|uniref:hypothetical protein n=1 Tax=Paenibacillus sp. 1_12 TaxID=1566278 RepID=UPI0008DF1468
MNTSERLGVISGSAERKSEHLRWITRGFFLLLLALSISFQIVPQTAYAASTITPDGTYNFGGTLGIDGSGGGGTTAAGFATLGDNKFVVSNRFMNGDLPSPTALWSNDQVVGGAIGSLTIKAAGTKVQTFTFNNLGISTYENVGQSLESITVVLYDIGGSVISTLTSGTGKVINLSNSVSQLGTLINSGAAYNINNVASLKLTWHYNNITVAPSNLNIENITISNVKAAAWTASASAATLTPVAGVDDAVTLTVKNSSGSTDTGFSGARNVTVTGYAGAPDGSYGSFNGTTLSASTSTISVNFTNGVAVPNLKLNKVASQTIGFSVAGVDTPATNTLSLTPTAGSAASMALTTDIIAPASNGGTFAQQPAVTLRDAYGNVRVNDTTTSVTVSRKDAGTWMLTGTATKTASAGVVTFT